MEKSIATITPSLAKMLFEAFISAGRGIVCFDCDLNAHWGIY